MSCVKRFNKYFSFTFLVTINCSSDTIGPSSTTIFVTPICLKYPTGALKSNFCRKSQTFSETPDLFVGKIPPHVSEKTLSQYRKITNEKIR
jgi:hypothetical protein